jgi:hypothetical protein
VAADSATFRVSVSGAAPFRFQWRLNNVDVPLGTNATLVISNVQDAHAGNYVVVVTNSVGAVTSAVATLTVVHRPSITEQPQPLTVSQGAAATLMVRAAGTPPLAYRWRFNGAFLPGATSSNYAIAAAQPTDAGDYSVVVTNSFGSVTSTVATLTVLYPPVILTQPSSRQVIEGGTASFSANAAGTAPLQYQWRLNEVDVLLGTNTTLVITNVQDAHAGNYVVVVTKQSGRRDQRGGDADGRAPAVHHRAASVFNRHSGSGGNPDGPRHRNKPVELSLAFQWNLPGRRQRLQLHDCAGAARPRRRLFLSW